MLTVVAPASIAISVAVSIAIPIVNTLVMYYVIPPLIARFGVHALITYGSVCTMLTLGAFAVPAVHTSPAMLPRRPQTDLSGGASHLLGTEAQIGAKDKSWIVTCKSE